MNKPNYTQIPNLLLDNMADFTHAEFKVMMYICRRTFGFQKEADKIALSQMLNGIKKEDQILDSGTGLSRQGLINSLENLESKGYITSIKTKNRTTKYLVNLLDHQDKVVNSVDDSSQLSRPQLVNSVDTQKKGKESKRNKDSEQVAYTPKDYLNTMRNSEKPIDRIIGIYLQKTKPSMPTKAIAQEVYRRHLRAAKKLVPWTENDKTKRLLMNAFNKADSEGQKNDFEFTLETVYKYLTK